MRKAARAAVNATMDTNARLYLEASPERRRDFLRRLWSGFDEITDEAAILAQLEVVARNERRRAGQWTRNTNRIAAAEGFARAIRAMQRSEAA